MDWSFAADLAGTFFFAISGCMVATRRGYDVIGSLLLGALTGLGGGIMRDLVLGVPPAAFAQPVHFLPPIAAALLVYFLAHGVARFPRTLLLFDAGGLALFCTTGTVAALHAGMNLPGATILGVTTGVGGGLLRDVVANRDPQLFNPNDLYAVPAIMGAALIAILWFAGGYSAVAHLLVAILVFAFRVLSLRFHWHVPHAATTVGDDSKEA